MSTTELLISSDSHASINHDDVKRHLASRFHDDYDGAVSEFGRQMATTMGRVNQSWQSKEAKDSGAAAKPAAQAGNTSTNSKIGIPGHSDPVARLADMDLDGVQTEIVYCEVSAFRYLYLLKSGSLEATQAFNDTMIEFGSVDPTRLIVNAQIPIHDIEAAVSEVRRVAGLGVKSLQLPVFPPELGLPDYYDERYHPLWAAITETGLPICCHIGLNRMLDGLADRDPTPGKSVMIPCVGLSTGEALGMWVLGGVFERFPDLKVVYVEPGLGWVAWWLFIADDMVLRQGYSNPLITKLPSEYFHRNVFLTFIDEPDTLGSPKIVERLGVGNIMWSTDYPHPVTSWPNSRKVVEEQFRDVSAADRELILRANTTPGLEPLMTGVLDGLSVLDLSWGVSGPVAAMLLADHGAAVTRIEPPDGDPFAELSGYRTWQRGKRRAVLDLRDATDHDRFLRLAARADVLVESYQPGVAAELGISYDTLREINPRLVYCSITPYGQDGAHAGRPGIDALVAARTGHDFEGRGTVGGTIGRLSGTEGILPGLEAPPGCRVGPDRDGPLCSGPSWISMACAYIATMGISAAIYVRERTGRGQWVQTSMLQGALATTLGAWTRGEHSEATDFVSWIVDQRAPRGFFRGSDGRWVHNWTPLPAFVLGASAGDTLDPSGASAPKDAPMRIGVGAEEMIVLQHYIPLMAEAVARFPSADWVRVAAEVGVPVQPVRSPEEALLDPALVADGCVIEVDDAEHGRIRQVGHVYELSKCPTSPPRPAVPAGANTAQVVAEADALPAPEPVAPSTASAPAQPLAGIKVLDLGLAVAGPWGTQMLAELGADVIKVNNMAFDRYWMSNHIAMTCNRSKRSISINLKDPEGKAILDRLVADADVVQHNMRYDAAERLGVDDKSLRALNPELIYCHTRGFEHGERTLLPGNDQTGAALAGTTWMDGGVGNDGQPIWSVTSLGDTGNGFLSAIGIIQALWHRDRTGEGQFLDTSIIYAQLLNASSAWVTPDGSVSGDRHTLDAGCQGMSALYRLYRCADERWIALGAYARPQFRALCAVIGRPDLDTDDRFAPAGNRSARDAEMWSLLEEVFAGRPAGEWFDALDAAGVPAEIADPDFVLSLFDDPEFVEKGWVAHAEHPVIGRMDSFGNLVDLSETPGRVRSAALIPGQDSSEILAELGYTDEEIAKLIAADIVQQSELRTPYS